MAWQSVGGRSYYLLHCWRKEWRMYIHVVLYNVYIHFTKLHYIHTVIMKMEYWKIPLILFPIFRLHRTGGPIFWKFTLPSQYLRDMLTLSTCRNPSRQDICFAINCFEEFASRNLPVYPMVMGWQGWVWIDENFPIVRIVLSGSGEIQLGWVFEGLLEC